MLRRGRPHESGPAPADPPGGRPAPGAPPPFLQHEHISHVRILYIWDSEYPWDVRAEKICRALSISGHDVTITARNGNALPRTESRPEGTIERLPGAWGRLGRMLSFPAFFNPFWLWHSRKLVQDKRIELVIVRDLPLAPTAVFAAAGKVPLILDMAENYPAMIRDVWTDGRQKPWDWLVRNPQLVAAIERWTLRHVDHVMTVIEESRARLTAMGLDPSKSSVVSNTPPRGRAEPAPEERPRDQMRMIYLGLMEFHRGVACTLNACRELKRAGVAFHLDLVGDGRDYEELRRHAERLTLASDEVTFWGRLAHADALELVRRANVGLVPHEARESWNTTIPNKLFDYMAAGLTVVTSDALPAARIVRATGAGLVFESDRPDDLAANLRRCVDPGARAAFGAAGRSAILRQYNWEADVQTLLKVVAEVRPTNAPAHRAAAIRREA